MNQQTKAILVVFAVIVIIFYFLIQALPMMIALAGNVLYLVVSLLFIVSIVLGLVKLYKYIANS